MKPRILAILFVVVLVLWMAVIWCLAGYQMLQGASGTDRSPGSSTAPAETTVETPPTGLEAFAANSDTNASNLGKVTVTPILGYLALVGTLLGIYVLYKLIPRFVGSPELVVEVFRNSSGDEALDGVVGGLSRLARQKLLSQMEILQLAREASAEAKANRETRTNALRETSAQAKFERKTSANALKFYYPREAPDQSLNELVSPLKELAPDQFKAFLVFIGAAFPRRGIRVRTDLQRRNNLPGGLGISFELEDMSNRQEPDLGTIWEPTAEVMAAGDPQPPTTTPAGQPLSNRKGHRRAAKVDAKKTETPATETEAKALYTVGALYEGDGDLEQAKSRYEDAFKKQPTSVEKYAALKRVLEKEHALIERYNDLLDSAVRWLALQIDRRGWLAKKISPGPDRERYLGEVYNNFGVLYQASGPPYGSFFYRLAVEDFERAIAHRGDWHAPYMQLAVTYSFMGRDGEPHRRDVFQRKALREYDRALRQVDQEAEPKVADAVKIGRAIVQLLTRDTGLKAKAEREIQRIEESNNIITKLLRTRTKEEDVSLLYNLACWYSMAYDQELKIADAKEISLRHLTYCLAADRKRKKVWDWAEIDPDLKPIRNSISGGLTSLKDELSMLPEEEPEKYSEALRDIPRKLARTKEAEGSSSARK